MSLPAAVRAGLAAALLAGAALAAPAVAGAPATRVPTAPADSAQRLRCDLTDAPAATRGEAAAAPAPPLGTAPCTGVRPGAQIQTPFGPCSMGFLFAGSDGRRYVTTAGHCVLDPVEKDGEKIWPTGSDRVAKDDAGKRIGTVVYAVRRPIATNGITDFALIRLDPGVASNPQMCHFGGPTSLAAEVNNDAAVFQHVGTGIAGLRSRTALAPQGLYRADYVYAHGIAYLGDSGGALSRDDGAAVGQVTQLTYGALGNIGINRISPHVIRAGNAIRVNLTLLTAPLL